MKKNMINRKNSESGIALVTSLMITLVILMLISGLSYLMLRGFSSNVLNRQFTTAYEAANGGVEYGAGIIDTYIDTGSIAGMLPTPADETKAINMILNCTTAPPSIFNFKTADDKYKIDITMKCLGTQPIPGQGGAVSFPPPPSIMSGGGGTWYIFFSINADATEYAGGTEVKARTESVYRVIM